MEELLPLAIVFDIDGTVALHPHRGPYDTARAGNDLPNIPVVSVIRSFLGAGVHFIAVSGRNEQFRGITVNWLRKYAIPFEMLLMRADGDQRADYIVKRELYEEHIEGKYLVHFVLDDRNQTVKLWRELGLPCFQVADGDF